MMLAEHERAHSLGPIDVGLKNEMVINIARTTNQTGEQFHFQVPIYPDDSRDMVNDRVNFCLSIMQDRMEDENKRVLAQNELVSKARDAKMLIEKNHQTFVNKAKALEKSLRKGAFSEEEYKVKLTELQEGLAAANAQLEADLQLVKGPAVLKEA